MYEYMELHKVEAVFTKIEMNNEWNVHFLQNDTLAIPNISVSIPLVASLLNFFYYGV